MKKLILFLAFFGCVALTANAQSCTKSASKSCCAKTTAANTQAAAKLASLDANIEAKTCATSGTVSYYKNYTCEVSGKTTTTQVAYDASTQKFVNVSPMAKEKASGGISTKKTTKAVKTSAKKVSTTKKSCAAKCSKGAKSCSKSAKVEN